MEVRSAIQELSGGHRSSGSLDLRESWTANHDAVPFASHPLATRQATATLQRSMLPITEIHVLTSIYTIITDKIILALLQSAVSRKHPETHNTSESL